MTMGSGVVKQQRHKTNEMGKEKLGHFLPEYKGKKR